MISKPDAIAEGLPATDSVLVFGMSGVKVTGVRTTNIYSDDILDITGNWHVVRQRPLVASTGDSSFPTGSHVQLGSLTPLQVENLATLAEVWSFLKYHHAAVTSGQQPWGAELLRMTPPVAAAPSVAARNTLLLKWIDALGPVAACAPCQTLESASSTEHKVLFAPDLAWLDDTQNLRRWPCVWHPGAVVLAARPPGQTATPARSPCPSSCLPTSAASGFLHLH